ncbi:BnaCnng23980D [Brassica napus]|uniref:BnaCnng23980D protein n=1 Tax=Brassica napus TaxID=3708 RepID=A0A078IT55_BRANA|nr:BnaCnng23980D [Brassica napus]
MFIVLQKYYFRYVDLILGEFKHYKHKACSRRHSTGGSKPPAGIWN